jgi:Glycosyl hydrolases family 2, sugar binding domain
MEAGRTIVPLRLEPSGSVFVVFRKETSELRRELPEPISKVVATLQGPWDLSFPEGRGAPPRVRFDTLSSWTSHAEPGIKYFSGTATYVTTFSVNRSWLRKRSRVRLDLGSVKNLAEVSVNGKSLGVLWKTPFAIDITDSLRAGDNRLEVKITNLWPNRMIGDKQPGAQRIAYATFDPFKADSPLLPSGLLGPVTLAQVTGL